MGSVFTCKLNPCCGDRLNCEPPSQHDEPVAALPKPALVADQRCTYCKSNMFQAPNLCQDCREKGLNDTKAAGERFDALERIASLESALAETEGDRDRIRWERAMYCSELLRIRDAAASEVLVDEVIDAMGGLIYDHCYAEARQAVRAALEAALAAGSGKVP